MSVINSSKKAFDPSIAFMFFGSWVQAIECLESVGIEKAYRLFKAIAAYCMYDEDPDFDDDYLLNAIWAVIQNEANNSIARRKSQFDRDELNENHSRILEALKANPGFSHRQIAEIVGVSPSTVDRVCRKYPEDIWNSSAHPVSASSLAGETHDGGRVTSAGNTPSDDCITDSYSVGYTDSVTDYASVNGNDTMMRRSDAHKKVYRGHFREDMARIMERNPDDDELPF